ncbi:MAG: hypothetical protein AB7O97_18865 [Planctomycetota bacterium]
MRIPSALALPLAVAALCGTVAAQTPNNLIGLTRNVPRLEQRDHVNCVNLPPCTPPGFPPAAAQPYAGGTGWDPMRNGAVISDGFLLAEVDPDTCAYICPPLPAPLLSPNAVVTGLEVVESLNQVWMLDSFGNLYQLQHGCPPTPIASCNTGLPLTATNATGGLAVDEKNRFVFYSYTNWTTGANTVHIARMNNPCQVLQVVTPAPCPITVGFRGITGLGVDACRQILYLTDGVQTMGWPYTVTAIGLGFGPPTCCVPSIVPAVDPWVGLAVRSSRATSVGAPCANGACPPCPMQHVLRNSSNLGNGSFALGLDNMAFTSLAWCAISLGACNPIGPIVPPLCGPVLLGGAPILTLGPVLTPVGLGCGANATWGLPLPMDPVLCGTVLSSQCVAFCTDPTGASGISLSNCLSWELQSN